MIVRLSIFLFLCGFTFKALSHGAEASHPKKWNEETLVLRKGDNWSTERCLELKGKLHLEFEFLASTAVKFDLHMHPELEDKAYSTVHFFREEAIKEKTGKLEKEFSGVTCFDFFPVARLAQDESVQLRYRYY